MESKINTEFLIVGGGLAGSVLSLSLIDKGFDCLVVDELNGLKSSRVAAGLCNPLTGPRHVKTWMADEIFPILEKFYSNWQTKLVSSFVGNKKVYVPFKSIEDLNTWTINSTDSKHSHIIEIVAKDSSSKILPNSKYGGMIYKNSGNIFLWKFLNSVQSYLTSNNKWIKEKFDYSHHIPEDSIYKNIKYKYIIFAQGSDVKDCPYFSNYPFTLNKGEILNVELTNFQSKYIINTNGIFILPTEKKEFIVGATYDHTSLDLNITEKAKTYLLNKLQSVTSSECNIISQKAGIRPTTKDRRPIIGQHPSLNNIFCFNGLGTKGVTLAPYFANQLIDNIIEGKPLNHEVDICRFMKKN